jgi:glutathione peroxidase
MRSISTFLITFFIGSFAMSANLLQSTDLKDINGDAISQHQGKTVLFVNIATKCGYTPQLKGLEKLYQDFKGKNFVVVGIPANDFGGQTPEKEPEVKKFCELNYGVTFPLTNKLVVKGEAKHPFVANLIKASGDNSEIGWNFEKFLVNKKGEVVGRFKSSVKPEDTNLRAQIQKAL